MFKANIGAFDGRSWEALCQQVFKRLHANDGYQHIPATPGDFGLEGFCAKTGIGFQCYCPDRHYTRKELYEHQRTKITNDLRKLSIYRAQVKTILGDTQLGVWRFVTPEIGHNSLLAHARSKEKETRGWNLPFLKSDFSIELHDADYYLVEINQIRSALGQGLDFCASPAVIPDLTESQEIYEQNVLRKSHARLAFKAGSTSHSALIARLNQNTLKSFLEADGYFREIERTAPTLYFKLARVINEFEYQVQEQATTWAGSPEELTTRLRHDLEKRLLQIGSEVTTATADCVARHMVARWIAVCTLDYE